MSLLDFAENHSFRSLAISAFLIGITALVLLLDALLCGRRTATMDAQRKGHEG